MDASLRAGRVVGGLLLVQMAGAYLVNFVLTAPLFGEPGFLVGAAANAERIGLSALVGVALGLVSLGVAVAAFPVLRRHALSLALLHLALVVAGFAATVVENAGVMSMLSLSQAYARAGAGQEALFQALRGVVASARNWMHFLGLVVSGSALFVLYTALLRFALVPRALAACGLVAVALQLTSVSMPIFGRAVDFRLLAPLGLCQLALAAWLLARGFVEGVPRPPGA